MNLTEELERLNVVLAECNEANNFGSVYDHVTNSLQRDAKLAASAPDAIALANKLHAENERLRKDVRALVDALEFYADDKNYLSEDTCDEYKHNIEKLTGLEVEFTIIDQAGQDRGQRAREALAAFEKKGL